MSGKPKGSSGPVPVWPVSPAATPPPVAKDADREMVLDLYKAYLEDLGRVGSRHETTRAFYLTLISALFTFLGLSGADGLLGNVPGGTVLVAAFGLGISAAWFSHMNSFRTTFKAKREVFLLIEQKLPFAPFTQEQTETKKLRSPLTVTQVDMVTAGLTACIFIGILLMKLAEFLGAWGTHADAALPASYFGK